MNLKNISFLMPEGFEVLQDFVSFMIRTISDQSQSEEAERLFLSGGF